MPAAVVTTGSTVIGLVPGLRKSMSGSGQGVALVSTLGNPSGIVTPPGYGAGVDMGVSGATIAFDAENNKFYMHISGANGNVWNQLGSVAFA